MAVCYPFEDKLTIGLLNTIYITLFPNEVFPMPTSGRGLYVAALLAFGCVFWIFTIRGAYHTPNLRPIHLLLGLYLSMTAAWIWHPSRLLTPLLPLALLVAYKGLPRPIPRWITLAFALTPLSMAVFFAKNTAAQALDLVLHRRKPMDHFYRHDDHERAAVLRV